MNLHRLRVDVRLERGVVIRELRKFVGHSSSVGADRRIRPNRTMVLHMEGPAKAGHYVDQAGHYVDQSG